MSIIPGKRQTRKGRLIGIIKPDLNNKEGYLVLALKFQHKTDNLYTYRILSMDKCTKFEKYINKRYTDDLRSIRGEHMLASILYVDGQHSMDEVLYGLKCNEEYIYTG